MKMIKKKTYLIMLLFFLFSLKGMSQNIDQLYIKHDSIVGLSYLDVYNGPLHINDDFTLEGEHRYFLKDFSSFNITYQGQTYYNITSNYDLVNDELIVKPYKSKSKIAIRSIESKIDSFYTKQTNQVFINLKKLNTKNAMPGYYEKLGTNQSQLQLFIKHKKLKKDKIKGNQTFLYFPHETTYYILNKNILYEASDKKVLIQAFPDKANKISDFFKKNKKLLRTHPELFFKNLIQLI